MTAAVPSVSARPAAPVRTQSPSAAPHLRYPSGLPDHSIAHPLRQPHGAVFSRRWLATSVALLSVHGDIDATNTAAMTDYALAEVMRCEAVILDLHGLSFCGTEGFVALHRISVSYAAVGTRWAVVAGPAVSRLLAMCDPAGALPHASTMNLATIGLVWRFL